jgi:two-component system OmpR family sensor kinase
MSLRARLLLGMAVVGVVLVVASLSINRATERNLVRQVDQQLERTTPSGRGDRRPPFGPGGGDGTQEPPSALYAAVFDLATEQLTTLRLPNTTERTPSPPALDASTVADRAGGPAFTVEAEEGDLRYRVLIRSAADADGDGDDSGIDAAGELAVVYALPLEDVDESIDRLLAIQAIAAAVILGVLGLVTFWVLRLGVRPVQQMTATAKAIGEGELSQRIPDTAPGTEAGELGLALNQMLGRLEEAFDERTRSEERLRRFVADASHELRTPVTTIRGYAELYRMGGLAERPQLDEAMRRTEQEATRMGQLVGDLLGLARLDQGRPLQLGPLDLSQLAADGAADLGAVDPERPIAVDAAEPVPIVGDEALLRQVVANLTTNARVHTAPGTPIAVRAGREADHAVLEIADQGPGMAPDVAARAFERFYRADPARARQTGGSGLGLAIVAAAVAAHHGTIDLDTAPGAGTTVRIRLPLRPPLGPGGHVELPAGAPGDLDDPPPAPSPRP